MIYSRCKCGNVQQWGSGMPPAKCDPCPKCGTIPATGPDCHPDPVPHDFSFAEQVETDEGPKTLSRCRYCLKTKKEIEERDARRLARKSEAEKEKDNG